MTQKRYFALTIIALAIVTSITFLEAPPLFDNDYFAVNPSNAFAKSEKININKAVKAELMLLNGIGEVKADAIIEYRNSKGKFKIIDDIKNVKGISDKIFSEIKDKIEV